MIRSPRRLLLFTALALFAGCKHKYPTNYREYAFVSNTGSNTVSVIDVLALKIAGEIPVGAQPTGMAFNAKRNEVYVVNAGSASVTVIDALRKQVAGTIAVGRNPYFIDVSPDGDRAVVANSSDNTVSILDLATRKQLRAITVGGSPGLARFLSGTDGRKAVAVERGSDSISILDVAAGKVLANFPVCGGPTDASSPIGDKLFVACSASGQIAVVQISNDAKDDKLIALLPVGQSPVSLAAKPDTGEVFSANFNAGTISEILTDAASVNATYYIGAKPSRVLVSADNSLVYVSNFGSDNIAAFSIDSGKVFASVNVGSHPDAIALSRNGNFLFVADSGSNDVAIVRTRAARAEKPTLLTIVPVGMKPSAVVIASYLSQ